MNKIKNSDTDLLFVVWNSLWSDNQSIFDIYWVHQQFKRDTVYILIQPS